MGSVREYHQPLRSGLYIKSGRNNPNTGVPEQVGSSSSGGTLTGLARKADGTLVLGTNAHVMSAGVLVAPIGDEEMYQGEQVVSARRVGNRVSWVAIQPTADTNTMDFATVELIDREAGSLLHNAPVHTDRRVISGVKDAHDPDPDTGEKMKLLMVGAVGGEGEVEVVAASTNTQIDGINVTGMVALDCRNRKVKLGDSGAPCYWRDNAGNYHLVCVVFGFRLKGNRGYAIPASRIESVFDIKFGNSPPIVLAGRDKLITVNNRVTLEGSVSDPDPADRDYVVQNHTWTQDDDNPAEVTLAPVEGYPAQRTFTPSITGDYTFTLTAKDKEQWSVSDEVKVKVLDSSKNLLPTNISALPAADIIDFSWTGVSIATGYEIQVGEAEDGGEIGYASYTTTASPCTVENLDQGTRYYYRVRMTNADGVGPWSAVASTVTAIPANHLPTANAGADQTVEAGATVTLDGSGSSDQDGDDLTYAWKQVKGPKVTLTGANTVRATFTAPSSAAVLRFRLTVTDEHDSKDRNAVIITVTAPTTEPTPDPTPDPPTTPEITPPTGITATATANSVTVKWKAVSGATGYILQLGELGEDEMVGYDDYTTTKLTQTVGNLKSSTRYYYRVKSKKGDEVSSPSSEASLITPARVYEDTGEMRNEVTGDWTDTGRIQQDPVDDSWEKEQRRTVTWEKEQRCTNCAAGAPNKWVSASRTDTQWVPYTPPPPTPTGITATSTHNSVTVSWGAAQGATGYILQLGELEEDEEIGYANYTTTGLTRTVSNLKSRTRYYYRVKSVNAGGESSPSVAASLLTKAPPVTHRWTWVSPAEYTGCGPTRKRRQECSNGHARHTRLVSASEPLVWSDWSDTGVTRNSDTGSWRDDDNTRGCGPNREKRQRRTISREKEQESTNQCGGRKTQWVSTTSRTETRWVDAPEPYMWRTVNDGTPTTSYTAWSNLGEPYPSGSSCKQVQIRQSTTEQRRKQVNHCNDGVERPADPVRTTRNYRRVVTVTETWGDWTDTGRTREDPITFIVEYEQERFSSPCNRRQTRWEPETG